MSKDLSKFNVISSRPLEYVERFYPEYEIALSRKSDKDNEEYEQMYLYQVFLKRSFKVERGSMTAKSPITSIYFCFAPSEEEAIMQVNGMAFPEYYHITDQEMEDAGGVKATATRIPFHIRGWGHNTF